jgi:hypothetical protein
MANWTKYRVKQIGDKYYPQKKRLLFWKYIRVCTCSDDYYGRITTYSDEKEVLCFDSCQLASEQITNYKNNYLRSFLCLGHIVKTYFNKDNGVYYYIDMTTKKLYSDNSEQLCEFITAWEERKEKEIEAAKQKKLADKKVTIHKYVED